MCMHNLDRRIQLLLDEPRYRKVAGEAQRRHVSVAAVIRQAIDGMPASADGRRDAIAQLLAADPMPVPSHPSDLRRESDEAHERER